MKNIDIRTMKIDAGEDRKSILRKCSEIFSDCDTDGTNGYEFMIPEAKEWFHVPDEEDPDYDDFEEDVCTNQYWEEKFLQEDMPVVDMITDYADAYISTLTSEDHSGAGYKIIPLNEGLLVILATD